MSRAWLDRDVDMGRIPMLVIYRPTTRDYPGKWVVRLHYCLPHPQATDACRIGNTLDEVRADLPAGSWCLGRQPGDDPTIEEVWLL